MTMNLAFADNQLFFDAVSNDDPVVLKLLSFSRLRKGWYFGTGHPPSMNNIVVAIAVSNLLLQHGAKSIEAFPDADGGILVTGYRGEETIELLCRPEGTFDYLRENADEEVDEATGLNRIELERRLGTVQWLEENSLDSYTRSISAARRIDTRDSRSRTLLEVAFPSSTQIVSTQKGASFVNISSDTMQPQWRGIRQSFGDSKTTFFRTAAA